VSKLSFKGVLIGGIVDVAASFVLGIPLAVFVVSKIDMARIPKDQLGAAITAAMNGSVALHVAQLVVGLSCSVLGGYTAARIAKGEELLNGVTSAWLCLALGLLAIAMGKDHHSVLMQVVMFIASPVMGLLGGYPGFRHNRALVGTSELEVQVLN
jgi:hypothetical protein